MQVMSEESTILRGEYMKTGLKKLSPHSHWSLQTIEATYDLSANLNSVKALEAI